MAQVNATINGRQFRMACEDGQEEHLQKLAENLDERIVELRGKFGEIGDTRLTVMAALTVADELAEAEKRCGVWRRNSPRCRTPASLPPTAPRRLRPPSSHAFNSAAERLEGMTKKLNATLGSGVAAWLTQRTAPTRGCAPVSPSRPSWRRSAPASLR